MAIGHLCVFLVFLLLQVWLFLMMAASAKVQGRPVGVASVPACCTYHVECCQRLTAEAPLAVVAFP
ncbi:hypothetical protein ACQJBY_022253 [Aegilops geniculata]